MKIDGEVLEIRTGAVTVANAAPPTSVMAQGFGNVISDDGWLEVTIPASNNILQGLNSSLTLWTSALVKTKFEDEDLICIRGDHVKVTTSSLQQLVVYGEISKVNPIVFTCVFKRLTVFAPLETT